MDDNEFRLQYFERKHCFYTQADLLAEIQGHYVALDPRRIISGLFGLDVLGNPKSLIVGVSRSVEDLFYEPFMGAVEGPSEFAEGMKIGVRYVLHLLLHQPTLGNCNYNNYFDVI